MEIVAFYNPIFLDFLLIGLFMHHNFVRWSADELAGGPKQWFCLDTESVKGQMVAGHSVSGKQHL